MPRKKKRQARSPPPPPPIEYVDPVTDWLPQMQHPGLRCSRLEPIWGGWQVAIIGAFDAMVAASETLDKLSGGEDPALVGWWLTDGELMAAAAALPCLLHAMERIWREERTA